MAYNQTTRGLTSLYAIVSAEATDSEHPSHEEFADRYRDDGSACGRTSCAPARRPARCATTSTPRWRHA